MGRYLYIELKMIFTRHSNTMTFNIHNNYKGNVNLIKL